MRTTKQILGVEAIRTEECTEEGTPDRRNTLTPQAININI